MPVALKNTDLVFFPVPKIACTSIKYAILNHNEDGLADRMPGVMASGRKVRHVHIAYPSTAYTLAWELRYARRRWFAVVRDPIKRFLSGYANRVLHHKDLRKTDEAELAARGLSVLPDLEDFVERLEDYCAVNALVRHHMRPICRYLGPRPKRFDRLFTMAELDQIAPYCAAAGAPITLPHMQTNGPKLAVDDLSPAARDKLMTFYARDYRIYGPYMGAG